MYILEKKKLKQVLSAWKKHFDVYVPQKVESYSQFLPFDTAEPIELDNPHNTRFLPKHIFTAIRDNVEIQQPARSL